MGILVSIDNGGTLTDACAVVGSDIFHTKTLTTPYDLTECFIEVLKSLSEKIYGEPQIHKLLNEADYIRYSTTQGTNAVVERKGPRLGLIHSGKTAPSRLNGGGEETELFTVLVGDRAQAINTKLSDDKLTIEVVEAVNSLVAQGANRLVLSLSGVDIEGQERRVRNLMLRQFPGHLLGAVPILLSHELVDVYPGDEKRRTWTAILNSFLHPEMERFLYNAEGALRSYRTRNPLLIFRNDGNSTRVAKTVALKTYSSGPRGGLEGGQALAKHYGFSSAITMDIGGTTTDIGIIDGKEIRETRHGDVEGITVSLPLSHIFSIGAGGSSVFRVEKGKITVGPDSVGAAPGPACFGRGGTEATITDAYLLAGLFDPKTFSGGDLSLDEERARKAVQKNIAEPLGVDIEGAIQAMQQAYHQKIAENIGEHGKVGKGAILLAFGGAGPLSACGVADIANINSILVPSRAAVFSAFGIGFSDIAHSYENRLRKTTEVALKETLEIMTRRARRDMFAEGFDLRDCKISRAVTYEKGGKETTVALGKRAVLPKGLKGATDVRIGMEVVRPIAHFPLKKTGKLPNRKTKPGGKRRGLQAGGSFAEHPLYRLEDLKPGDTGVGPALIEESYFTCRVLDGWSFKINENTDIIMNRDGKG
ncbi:MAG: hydantoinase/oxoprolinase family protein [Rhodospirillales bacterium]|nr:hydantoinase/oxoprolinase family protein [Rhodospirillales bacterium]